MDRCGDTISLGGRGHEYRIVYRDYCVCCGCRVFTSSIIYEKKLGEKTMWDKIRDFFVALFTSNRGWTQVFSVLNVIGTSVGWNFIVTDPAKHDSWASLLTMIFLGVAGFFGWRTLKDKVEENA